MYVTYQFIYICKYIHILPFNAFITKKCTLNLLCTLPADHPAQITIKVYLVAIRQLHVSAGLQSSSQPTSAELHQKASSCFSSHQNKTSHYNLHNTTDPKCTGEGSPFLPTMLCYGPLAVWLSLVSWEVENSPSQHKVATINPLTCPSLTSVITPSFFASP